jgi:glyoxylase-like metal-dependent hydrolase (beta-lactamase superfamily II)
MMPTRRGVLARPEGMKSCANRLCERPIFRPPSRWPTFFARRAIASWTDFQKELDTGKHSSGTPLTDEEKEDLKNAIGKAASDAVSAEFRGLKVKVPDITFDRELDVDLGNREVQLKFLGRGNTAGDAVAYLPKEKILIAGDLVDSPVPFLYGGFPVEQIVTLRNGGTRL